MFSNEYIARLAFENDIVKRNAVFRAWHPIAGAKVDAEFDQLYYNLERGSHSADY